MAPAKKMSRRGKNAVTPKQRARTSRAAPIIPDELFEDIKSGNVVLFAGAGVSTESGPHGSPTFYEEIAHQLAGKAKAGATFPDLMQRFCEVIDGGQRHRLTRNIIQRIERFSAPGEPNAMATMLHRDVARIPQFTRVVTTNWDPFFERELNVLVPTVEDQDLAFWDDAKRQVLKIHGCVTRPNTIVATRNDYSGCLKLNPLIFNKLRDLLVTKTFLFAGFSLRDPDFSLVFDQITRRLGGFRRLCYAVDPDANAATKARWRRRKVKVIGATGVAATRSIVARLAEEGLIVSDDYLFFLRDQLNRIRRIHLERQQNSDGALSSAMYQDGLMHALGHVISGSELGAPRATFDSEREAAREALSTYWERKDVLEIAYWSGRAEVLERFCTRVPGDLPAYFDPYELLPRRKFKAGGRFEGPSGFVMKRFDKKSGS
jgi:hypothetical protein